MTGYFTVPSVSWGPAAIEQLSALGARKVFLLADPALKGRPALVRILEELVKSDTTTEVSHEVMLEPTLASIEPVAEAARRTRPDWIAAVGGGSTIDTARAAWCRLALPDLPLEQITPLVEIRARAAARFVAIPTTSGSGSEAAWVSQLKDGTGRPVEVGARELLPDWALVDPGLAASVPPAIQAECGADAIAHALEATLSEWSNPFADAMAREALALALPAVARITRHPEESDPRAALHYAATLAGIAAANAQLGVAHALAHALAGVFAQPHRRLVAAVLPYAMEFNFPSSREKLQALAAVVGPSVAQSRSALSERLRAAWEAAALPRSLAAVGVTAAALAPHRAQVIEWARASSALVSNPRIPSAAQLSDLLDAAVAGTPVGF
ncbi:MAG: iron-containing alcohol dehydrogenase [Thermoplasmata archaeon]|nr:iron-containing alcohol dehydrogenase [Thermoplasmata archaeon]